MRCHRCGTEWIAEDRNRPGFKETCVSCNAYLHCCKNCRFYQPGSHNDCMIGTTEWVGDKVKANYCDEFECAKLGQTSLTDPKNSARDALNSLFGGTLKDEGPDSPSDFDSLFKS